MSRMQRVRQFYGVPAKRGATVRASDTGEEGKITSTDGNHLRVRYPRDSTSWRWFHPCALDYQAEDGSWLLGEDFLRQVNEKIERFNQWLNRGNEADQ